MFSNNLALATTDTLVEISLNIHSTGAFALNIGKISVQADSASAVATLKNSESSLLVYPNPCSGKFSVSMQGTTGPGTLSIFNLQGSKVLQTTLKKEQIQKLELPAKGIYIYELNSGSKSQQGKIVVE